MPYLRSLFFCARQTIVVFTQTGVYEAPTASGRSIIVTVTVDFLVALHLIIAAVPVDRRRGFGVTPKDNLAKAAALCGELAIGLDGSKVLLQLVESAQQLPSEGQTGSVPTDLSERNAPSSSFVSPTLTKHFLRPLVRRPLSSVVSTQSIADTSGSLGGVNDFTSSIVMCLPSLSRAMRRR